MSLLVQILAVIGAAVVAVKLGAIVSTLSDTLIKRNALPKYGAKADNWAIVTGCTAGIGEQFALQLAHAGFNLGLVGRNQSKLDALAAQCQQYKVKTATFVLDAANPSDQVYVHLEQWAKALSVSILVNNVGISHEMPVKFADTTEAEMLEIINVNNVATLQVTKAVLPSLQAFTAAHKKQRGLILTMGSFAGLAPSPMLATYSGSKFFLQGWSSALATELKPQRIDAQLIVSYMVVSAMSKVRRSSATTPTAEQFVQSALSCIGRRGGAQERADTMTPFWSHALMHRGMDFLGVWGTVLKDYTFSMHASIRKRALQKREREQAQAQAQASSL